MARTQDERISDRRSAARRRHTQAPRKGDLRRTAILDAAEAELRRRPALDLTIDHLAESVGVSRSSVYFYFDSKWTVIDALIDRASVEMLNAFRDIPTEASFDDFVARSVSAALAGWRTHTAVFLAAAERSSHSDGSTDRWRRIMQQFADLIARRVEHEAAADPDIDPKPMGGAERAAQIGCWMVERNLYMLFSRAHKKSEEDAAADHLREALARILGDRRHPAKRH